MSIYLNTDAVAALAGMTSHYLTELAGRRMDFVKAAKELAEGGPASTDIVRRREDLMTTVDQVRIVQPALFDITGGFGPAGSRIAEAFEANVIVGANSLHQLLSEDAEGRLHNDTENYVGDVTRMAADLETNLVAVVTATQQQAQRIMEADHQAAASFGGGFGW